MTFHLFKLEILLDENKKKRATKMALGKIGFVMHGCNVGRLSLFHTGDSMFKFPVPNM